jgi:hypothetical protein
MDRDRDTDMNNTMNNKTLTLKSTNF